MCATEVFKFIDLTSLLRRQFIVFAVRFSLTDSFRASSVAFAFVRATALSITQWVFSLIDHALQFFFHLLVIFTVGVSDTIVHLCAADSVSFAFIIFNAAIWTHFVKLLVNQAHVVWLRVRFGVVVVWLRVRFGVVVLIIFLAAGISIALAPSVAPSVPLTIIVGGTFVFFARVQ